ncbi:MAG: LVIVD repeat-containing protein, partial [Planctomycetota bacterium]
MRSAACVVMLAACVAGSSTDAGADGGFNVCLVGHWDSPGTTFADVWQSGAHAYLGHFGSSGVDIVDIADPAAPFRVVTYFPPPPNQSASAQDVKVHDGLLFIGLEGSGSSAHIVDVRDPTNPVGLVDVAISGMTEIHNVFYDGGYLYMADSGTPRVGIVDLTSFDPDDPPVLPITQTKWMLADVGTSFVHDVTVVDGRLYASAWDSGVWVYDVTDIANRPPQLLGHAAGDNTHSCWPTSDGRFVITGEERSGGGITVYRMDENPDGTLSLTVTATAAVPPSEASSVHNQAVIGYRVYNSWYGAGMRVYDVDPVSGSLLVVANFDPPEMNSVWGIDPFRGQQTVLARDISNGL